jgi:dihydrofolate synthase/folylpolyglutamate synthase
MPNPNGFRRFGILLSKLGNPEQDLRVIHVAGTNGKGSVSVMTASILEKAGCSVGLYTSPHLETECERIQIWDGSHRMIGQDVLDDLMTRVRETAEEIVDGEGRVTLFEVYTAAAFLFFADEKPEYVVLECGLGGRLDMTNIIEKPLVSVITQVSLDHTAELGNTIYKIAREKAGIIKPGVPVVSQTPELAVKNIISRIAAEKGCAFIDASAEFGKYAGYRLGMQGDHQVRNAATAALAVKAAGIDVSDQAVREGLAAAVIPGRFDVIGSSPYWIIDGAHNPDAITALTDSFNKFAKSKKIKRTLVIFGCMKDKDYRRMIQLLTSRLRGCNYAAAAVDYDRAESSEVLGEIFASYGRGCTCYDSVKEAFDDASSSNFECILVTGSIYLAGAVRSYLPDAVSK